MITSIQEKVANIVPGFETDVFETADGKSLKITFIKHASLLINYDGHIIYTDPISTFADYSTLPKADMILITHEHHDHLDPKAIEEIETSGTTIVSNRNSYQIIGKGLWMKNGDTLSPYPWVSIKAVPAYNTTPDRTIYHPKDRDNGYVLHLGGSVVYLSGDTEDIPEMTTLGDVDIAFISVNQPYTMTIKQAVHAIQMIHPAIVYPYHYSDTDLSPLHSNAAIEKSTDLRIRALQ